MKKTLIALAVATSAAVSGSAVAGLGSFDAGNLNNRVDFGGTISPTPVTHNWVWAVGQGYNQYSNSIDQLTNSGRTLTITAADNMPILAGKVTSAFLGAPNSSPQIAFSNADGSVITPVWSGENAEGSLTLKVQDNQQHKIGTMQLNVKAISPVVVTNADGSTGISVRYTSGEMGDSAFLGSTGRFNADPSFAELNNVLVTFGAPSVAELQAQIKAFNGLGNVAEDTTDVVGKNTDWNFNSNANVYSGAYALGIAAGQQMVVTFDNAINGETQWRAPLLMQISYN